MHQKVNVVICIYSKVCPKRVILKERKKEFKFDHDLVFSCLHLLFPQQQFHSNFIITSFLCYGPLFFPTRAPPLPLPRQNPLGHVSE